MKNRKKGKSDGKKQRDDGGQRKRGEGQGESSQLGANIMTYLYHYSSEEEERDAFSRAKYQERRSVRT